MKTPALALFLVVLCSAVSAEARSRQGGNATVANITAESADEGGAVSKWPQNGFELLDWCSHLLRALDSPQDNGLFYAHLLELGWCAGYLAAIGDATIVSNLSLKRATSMGVKLTDPPPSMVEIIVGMDPAQRKTAQELAVPLSMICFPDGAGSPGQLTHVVVKWLRDHPERLHEPKTILTLDALGDAFPCQAPASTPDKE